MTDSFAAARAYFLKGLADVQAGHLGAAEAHFESSLALLPDRPSSLTNLGVTRFNLGKFEAACGVLQAACRMEPGNLDAWWFQGRALLALNQPQAALACLDQAVGIDPARALLWLHRSEAQLALNQSEAGLASLDQALGLDGRNGRAWSNRGVVLRDLGQTQEAARSFEKALETGADPALNTFYLAAVCAALKPDGDPPAAPGAAPRAYVEGLFDDYAQDFQGHLVDVLKYRGPELLMERLTKVPRRRYARVLDLGCGSGLCGPLIRPSADHLAGLDISGGMVEVALKTGVYDRLVHADALEFLQHPDRQPEGPYNLILAADVLNYVGALEALFGAVSHALEEGGLFCLTVELTAQSADLQLLPSLRYAHSEAYVRRVALQAGLTVDSAFSAPLREEQGVAQMALYVYLGKRQAAD